MSFLQKETPTLTPTAAYDQSMDKRELDEIIEKYKVQPVGHGYIDMIVFRDNYKSFVADLIKNNYKIESIAWWEWCSEGKKSEFGLGGPKSYYYDGWFSELSIGIDNIELNEGITGEKLIEELTSRIETKTIFFPNETVTFKQNSWLTPAIWVNVPDDWRNKYSV